MNSSDWTAATGHPLVGRGSRPINPRLLGVLPAKIPGSAKAKSRAWARQARRLIWQAAVTTGETDDLLASKTAKPTRHDAAWRRRQLALAKLTAPRGPPKSLSEYEYWNNIDTARARSDRVKQRIWRPDLG